MLENYVYLYVEDDALSREIMQTLMEKALEIKNLTMFSDSKDFGERLKALPTRPNVVLLDIHVEPHDGFSMLTMLRADPDFRDIKIIALTASVMNDEVDKLRESGFDGAIGKPLSLQTFPDLLKRILDNEPIWNIA
jgi:CheY-like chemotaxis protein